MKRPRSKKVVLQFRIPKPEYDELARAAKKRGISISEEAYRRISAWREPK